MIAAPRFATEGKTTEIQQVSEKTRLSRSMYKREDYRLTRYSGFTRSSTAAMCSVASVCMQHRRSDIGCSPFSYCSLSQTLVQHKQTFNIEEDNQSKDGVQLNDDTKVLRALQLVLLTRKHQWRAAHPHIYRL